MNYQIVDIDSWKRKTHYLIFKDYEKPRYDITFELDITKFYSMVKAKNLSFTMSFIYIVSTVANSIEEFRYRFEDGRLFMPFSVEVHHSFVDGVHLGKFANKLQECLNKF